MTEITAQQRVLDFIRKQGEILSEEGSATAAVVQGTGLSYNVVIDRLARLVTAGEVERDVAGKRTFRIAIAGHPRTEVPKKERRLQPVRDHEPDLAPLPIAPKEEAVVPEIEIVTSGGFAEQDPGAEFFDLEVTITARQWDALRATAFLDGRDSDAVLSGFLDELASRPRVKALIDLLDEQRREDA